MLISFAIMQFAPGGPVERIIAQITGTDVSATARIGGGQGDGLASRRNRRSAKARPSNTSKYRGAQGLDPEFIKQPREAVRLRQAGARALLPDDEELPDCSTSARATSAT